MKQRYLITAILVGSITCLGIPVQAITVTSTYTYDAINRLTHITYQTGLDIVYQFDAAGNITKVIGQPDANAPTLTDTIIYLQTISGNNPSGVTTGSDVNGDGRIGLPEAINVLQKVSK